MQISRGHPCAELANYIYLEILSDGPDHPNYIHLDCVGFNLKLCTCNHVCCDLSYKQHAAQDRGQS